MPQSSGPIRADMIRFAPVWKRRCMSCCLLRVLAIWSYLAVMPVVVAEVIPVDNDSAEIIKADVVVYGGTSSAVIAAVQVRRLGHDPVIVCPDRHLGGLSSGGLGFTDTGNKAVIGGLARDFYHRIWLKYQSADNWKWQTRDEYGNRGQGTPAIDGNARTMWIFEPHIAEQVFEDYIREFNVPVYRNEWLDRSTDSAGVKKSGASIKSIRMQSGLTFEAKVFIDATYEGDLMAAAGVDYHVGREANSVYGEQWNGVQTGVLHHRHHFGAVSQPISPFRVPDDPQSGVLPRISTDPPGDYGSGDHRIQAYCYRWCGSNHPDNRIPFPKPEGYDPEQYLLLLRIFDAGWRETFEKFDPIPNRKTDTNNHGPFSTDNIGMNYEYPEASYERRHEILKEHETYQKGWLYFVANDPRVPEDVRTEMQTWGLAKDEFTDNGGWPHQIYVREARRMVGDFVMTENELMKRRPTLQSVGMGSYTIDSHNVQRYITPDGFVQNEGDIGVGIKPYEISYGALVPKRDQATNLLVPVCVSSSHIAFGSIRMEPVFMILGQSAATAAVLSIRNTSDVQDVPYDILSEQLIEDGQVLTWVSAESKLKPDLTPRQVVRSSLQGIVIDDEQAELKGLWKHSSANGPHVDHGYRHDGNAQDGSCVAAFRTLLPTAGQYQVNMAWPPNDNRATHVRVIVRHSEGETTISVNQRERSSAGIMHALGTFTFSSDVPAEVVVSNESADGYVVVDAVQFLRLRGQ